MPKDNNISAADQFKATVRGLLISVVGSDKGKIASSDTSIFSTIVVSIIPLFFLLFCRSVL